MVEQEVTQDARVRQEPRKGLIDKDREAEA